MGYVLEDITAEDQERIIRETAQTLGWRHRALVYARDHDEFPKTWAIDRQRNCYMLRLPTLVRGPTSYLLVFDQQAHLAVSADLFARRMYFDDDVTPPPSLMENVKREFIAALKVYGMFGAGPLDENGKPTESVMPAFIEKPKGNAWL